MNTVDYNMKNDNDLLRNCPTCNKELIYKNKRCFVEAIRFDSKCIKCSNTRRVKSDVKDTILEMYNNGATTRKIANSTNLSYGTIGSLLKSLNLKSNGNKKKKIELVDDDNAKCSK
jgi:predicted transcriptional regulator